MRYIIIMVSIVYVFSCKNKQESNSKSITFSEETSENASVVIQMEGKTYTIQQHDLQPIDIDFKNNKLQYVIWQDGNPVQTNVNFSDVVLKETGTATYKIPEDNSPHIKIDLNFYNAERDAKTMNKRIIFRKGIIEIKQLTENKLQMSFDGEGGGMMDRTNNFPITGKLNVLY